MKKIILLTLCFLFTYGQLAFSQLGRGGTTVTAFKLGGEVAGKNRSIGNTDNFNFSILTNNQHRIHINANGDVGIGTTTPTVRLECIGQVKITGGNPGVNKVLTSDAVGLGSWILPTGGGFTDAGATIILTNINDNVGIGTSSPNAKLEVGGTPGASVGGFASGQFHVTNPSSTEFSNSVITFHNLFNGNTQGAYIGHVSSSNNDFAIINRQNAALFFSTNNSTRMTIVAGGNVGIGTTAPMVALAIGNNNTGFTANVNDLDLITAAGGVFKFVDDAFRAGLDASNYLEVGHGGSNSFINQVGTGGMDFRFAGVTKATFTVAGHLHLMTDVDQKHTLKIITANNLNDTGISLENSGGSFTHAMFRTDIGSNRADFVFAIGLNTNVDLLTNSFRIDGSVANLGNVEFFNKVGIGTPTPDTKFHVADGGTAGAVTPFVGTIATFESPGAGYLSILTPDANTRGILFGEPSSNVAGGIFYNDPGSPDGFQFRVNGNVTKMVIESNGAVGIGTTNPDVTAILHLNSTTKVFLPPRMTTTEMDAIPFPLGGSKIHDTTIDKSRIFTETSWKTILTEDLGQVVVQETFASSNVRFFGELALPAAQGWTDTATGSATIVLVTETVFGEVRQVVRHADNVTNGATTSKITLTAQNWVDINAFGASYSGTSRLNTAQGGSGFFSGLQANSAENPLATGNRRYGIFFNDNAGILRASEPDPPATIVTFDGTGGNPLITFDEWFSWECVVPAGLGAAQFYVNGILTTFAPTFTTNTGGLGTTIQIGSGSTSGTGRVVSHDNFGVTIYEEAATKTLAAATMVGNVAQVNIPEGKRDYVIILPDGSPRAIGSTLRLVASNLLGSISLENQNPSAPEVLYNGLRTLAIDVSVKEVIEGINTVSSGNVYLGFEIATLHIGGSFIDTTDQTIITVNIPQSIVFSTNKIIDGISHVAESDSFTINTAGVYKFEIAPQVGQGAGSSTIEVWIKKNNIDIVDSGIQETLSANSEALPILIWTERFVVNEGFKVIWASNSINTKLDNLTSLFGGPNIPSIMFHAAHVGN